MKQNDIWPSIQNDSYIAASEYYAICGRTSWFYTITAIDPINEY